MLTPFDPFSKRCACSIFQSVPLASLFKSVQFWFWFHLFFPESVELMNRKSQISILNDLSLIIGNDSARNVSYCSTTQLIFKVCDEIASAFFLVLNSLWLGNQFAQIMFLKRFAYQVHKPKCLALVPIKNVPKKLIYLQNRKG
jgi:hypothetical protein